MTEANLRKGTELSVKEQRETVNAAESQRTLSTNEFLTPLILKNVEFNIISVISRVFLSNFIKLKDFPI
jgi:hypothetical protein